MKIQIILASLLILFLSAYSPSLNTVFTNSKPGQAVIQYQNESYSKPMSTREGFTRLKSNEKLYLSEGRVELTEPLEISGLHNIQIIGSNTSLVAKIDMPVVTFKRTSNVYVSDLLVVHEVGEWCSQNCVEFYDSFDIEIKDCKFDGSGYFGLALTKVEDATITNNQFFNCEYGLAAWSSTNLIVKNNRFSKNRNLNIMVNDKGQFSNDFNSENTFE